jgi:CheY-like chemotaxis protein
MNPSGIPLHQPAPPPDPKAAIPVSAQQALPGDHAVDQQLDNFRFSTDQLSVLFENLTTGEHVAKPPPPPTVTRSATSPDQDVLADLDVQVGGFFGKLLRPITVLLLDDDPLFRRMFVDHFGSDDCQITACATQSDAFRHLETNAVDIIISDLHMPGMNGIDFLTEVRVRWGVSQGDLMILSSDESHASREEARQREVDAFILKSAWIEEIGAALKNLASYLVDNEEES